MFTLAARAAARQAAPVYRRTLATAAAAAERYPGGVQAMHWISGGSMLSCVGLVLVSGRYCCADIVTLVVICGGGRKSEERGRNCR